MFFDARLVQPEVAPTALAHIERLYRVERDAKELIGPDGLESEQAWLAWHRQRWALRQQHSWPLLAEFRQWLQATEQTVLPKSPVGQALQYVLPRWDGLVRYSENGALSIDNKLSERRVRPVAVGRKNYLFLRSDNGGTAAAILYRALASAKANQVEPFAYVRDLLVQLSGYSPPAGAVRLPDAWLTAQSFSVMEPAKRPPHDRRQQPREGINFCPGSTVCDSATRSQEIGEQVPRLTIA
jgi:hypothetical protein